jgi:hypothetical protein
MASKQEVAVYVSSLIEQLVEMCRGAGLTDLEFLLSVANAEAARLQRPAETLVRAASTH